jgi:hypothetical protein
LIFLSEGTSGGRQFKAKVLLASDRACTHTVKINDKPYGTWKFPVAKDKVNYGGRSVCGTADALDSVEGGGDAWWYCKDQP